MALLLLAMRYGTALLSKLPRPHWLESLGRASLPVFCAHLVVVLIALAWFGEANAQRSWGIDIGIVVGGFAVLFAVARISNEIDAWLAQRSVALRAHARS
jgi:peptidoglycan/LPS O-acetylase OafA/YrhL